MKMKFGRVAHRVESVFKKKETWARICQIKMEDDDVKHHNNLMNDGQQRKAYSAWRDLFIHSQESIAKRRKRGAWSENML
jgi:hypothetical protein